MVRKGSCVEIGIPSVGIDLKELGVTCRNVWNFAQGLKFKADFYSKMSVCRHEPGVQPGWNCRGGDKGLIHPPPHNRRQFQPWVSHTGNKVNCRQWASGLEIR